VPSGLTRLYSKNPLSSRYPGIFWPVDPEPPRGTPHRDPRDTAWCTIKKDPGRGPMVRVQNTNGWSQILSMAWGRWENSNLVDSIKLTSWWVHVLKHVPLPIRGSGVPQQLVAQEKAMHLLAILQKPITNAVHSIPVKVMYKNTSEGHEGCYEDNLLAAVYCMQLKAKILRKILLLLLSRWPTGPLTGFPSITQRGRQPLHFSIW
jgi:hypothetical protein